MSFSPPDFCSTDCVTEAATCAPLFLFFMRVHDTGATFKRSGFLLELFKSELDIAENSLASSQKKILSGETRGGVSAGLIQAEEFYDAILSMSLC